MKVERVLSLGICTLLLAALIACTTTPITGRSQLNFIGDEQAMQLGLSAFEEIKQETPISHDPELNAMLQRVGRRIAAAASNDLPDAQWEFVLFESEEPNAFALPGGKVGVYTGILPIAKDEAGLATIIGHEVAHAAARHSAERMSQAIAAQAGGQVLGIASAGLDPKVGALLQLAYPAAAQLGVLLPYSRKQEAEADQLGLIYMARAGYNPEEAIEFWRRFAQYKDEHGAGGGPGFLSTHPLDEDRIENLREWMPRAKAAFQVVSQ